MTEPTAAEIEAAATEIYRLVATCAMSGSDPDIDELAERALTAALPDHDARLREQVAAEHAAEVERLRAAVRQALDAVDWNSDGYNPGVARAILRDALDFGESA